MAQIITHSISVMLTPSHHLSDSCTHYVTGRFYCYVTTLIMCEAFRKWVMAAAHERQHDISSWKMHNAQSEYNVLIITIFFQYKVCCGSQSLEGRLLGWCDYSHIRAPIRGAQNGHFISVPLYSGAKSVKLFHHRSREQEKFQGLPLPPVCY